MLAEAGSHGSVAAAVQAVSQSRIHTAKQTVTNDLETILTIFTLEKHCAAPAAVLDCLLGKLSTYHIGTGI
jgi:hypothetical protein